MMQSSQWMGYAWVPVVLFATLAQTARNAAQRTLTQELGTLPATLVRFLYGLPFAALWLALLYGCPDRTPALPQFSTVYLGWIALGAFFQILGTAFLLLAMTERNFAVAVTLSKTEVLQVALFATV
ncbi:MAG: EamA/RhaT family transporter, partial [Proteobacteria bacterium]|nr:EamA/RhaT family transporter [Pseudomonadota bacterium]